MSEEHSAMQKNVIVFLNSRDNITAEDLVKYLKESAPIFSERWALPKDGYNKLNLAFILSDISKVADYRAKEAVKSLFTELGFEIKKAKAVKGKEPQLKKESGEKNNQDKQSSL